MRALKLSFLCALLSFMMTPAPLAQDSIRVAIPDTAGHQGDSVAIPIVVGDMTGQNVISYQAIITFDPAVLDYVGCSSTGTISEAWGAPFCAQPTPGQVNVGGYGTSALSGSGPLVGLVFDVVGNLGDSTQLHFQSFLFNAGDPQAAPLKDGKFEVLGIVGILTVTPESWDYDSVTVSDTVHKIFELRNDGTRSVEITDLRLMGGDGDFSLVNPPSTPFTLDLAAADSVTILFSPCSPGGKNATFEIDNNSDNASPSKLVPLTGTGIVYDVGVSITSCPDTVYRNESDSLSIDVFNAGNVIAESIHVGSWIVVGSDTTESTFTISNLSAGDTFGFHCDLFYSYTFSCSCTAYVVVHLMRDSHPENDSVSWSFYYNEVESRLIGPELPTAYSLSQNYPNPFNPVTAMKYALPRDCNVKLTIYNILGQKVITLVDEPQAAGFKMVQWDSRSQSVDEVTSGIYFYRLLAGDFVQTRKMVVLK